jgi:hypothetical protein
MHPSAIPPKPIQQVVQTAPRPRLNSGDIFLHQQPAPIQADAPSTQHRGQRAEASGCHAPCKTSPLGRVHPPTHPAHPTDRTPEHPNTRTPEHTSTEHPNTSAQSAQSDSTEHPNTRTPEHPSISPNTPNTPHTNAPSAPNSQHQTPEQRAPKQPQIDPIMVLA